MFAKSGGSPLGIATILAKLLGVDGTGSGLDADLLDGYHASAFLRLATGGTMASDLIFGPSYSLMTPNLIIPDTGSAGGFDIQAPMKYDETEILRFSALGITLVDPTVWATAKGNSPILNLAGWDISNINSAAFKSTGAGRGLLWSSTSNGWTLDVSPLTRDDSDGNFNIYGTGSNIALWRPVLFVYDNDTYITANCDSSGILQVSGAVTLADLLTIPQLLSTGDVSVQTATGTDAIFSIQSGTGVIWKVQQLDGTDDLLITSGNDDTVRMTISSDGSITISGTVNGRDMAADGAVIDDIPNIITTNEDIRDEAQVYAQAAEASAGTATTAATTAGTARDEAQESAASAATSLASVTEAGATQVTNIDTAGTTQVARVITEGDTQVANLETTAAGMGIVMGSRQTALQIPDMISVNSDGEDGSVENWCVSARQPTTDAIMDVGVDMLSGARGGMILACPIAEGEKWIMSSILMEFTQNYAWKTSASDSFTSTEDIATALTTVGPVLGAGTMLDGNVLVQMTTHRVKLDDAWWHYNPITGFAMCKFEGTGVARTVRHPMNKECLFGAFKNLGSPCQWPTWCGEDIGFMYLDKTGAATADYTPFWPDGISAHEISLSDATWINQVNIGTFMWGYFGDDLSDLYDGMKGMRGHTAIFTVEAGENIVIDTGIENIESIIFKTTTGGGWGFMCDAAGWELCSTLSSVASEGAVTNVAVSGSEVTFSSLSGDLFVIVIGKEMKNESTIRNQACRSTGVFGNGVAGTEVHLGHDFVSGDNGGMVFARNVEAISNWYLVDTLDTGTGHLVLNADYAHDSTSTAIIENWTTTGMAVGGYADINTDNNKTRFVSFGTTAKATLDGVDWQYNPETGFAMAEFTGDGVAGRVLFHPTGNLPKMMMVKAKSTTGVWVVYFEVVGPGEYMVLNWPAGTYTSVAAWNDTDPTDTTITLGDGGGVNADGTIYKIFIWCEVENVNYFSSFIGSATEANVEYTGLDDVSMVLVKDLSTGDWDLVTRDTLFGSWCGLNETAADVTSPWWFYNSDGSIQFNPASTNEVVVVAWSGVVQAGRDTHIQIPASADDPCIPSIAQGFSYKGQNDTVFEITSPISVTGDGTEGKRYIYITEDGTLNMTDEVPTYTQTYVNQIGWCFDCRGYRMYYDGVETPALFIGDCEVDANGNVYDIHTYATGDLWISDLFFAAGSTLYTIDNPWKHNEISVETVSVDVNASPSNEVTEWSLDEHGCITVHTMDTIAVKTNAYPSIRSWASIYYKLKIRRNF